MELRFTQHHVTALNFLLIAGLAYFAAQCVNDVIARRVMSDKIVAPAAIAQPRLPSGLRPRPFYESIVKRDVFNLVPQEAAAPPPVVVEDLHLKLLGTSMLSKSKPYAVIEDQNGEQSLYKVGDDIPDAGKLVSVERTRAIVDHDGRRVALEMPVSEMPAVEPSQLGGPSMPVPHMRHGPRPPFAPNGEATEPEPDDNDDDNTSSKLNIKKLSPGNFAASRAEVAKTMQNPAMLFTQMRAVPHVENGKTDGFAISEVKPGSVFEQIGMQNGDLVTSIDGQPVTNPMQAMSLMGSVQNKPSIDLTVSRGGSPMNLHLDLH
ncbi:MAG: type II secretion system protein GspC [Candidatus Binatus sp.]|uniref:type II secretion system protein GspC n=1 Tax=Candidatus Binatus sp. TaxID=2811406 RepID=UPI002715DE43|nr:type II secretion system protein GspC [Candidatus Binatus sp.]MDO8434229.1 type II secretion system protein GspC [Candidatus Binatus sp.]